MELSRQKPTSLLHMDSVQEESLQAYLKKRNLEDFAGAFDE
jgi:hypothetical protein